MSLLQTTESPVVVEGSGTVRRVAQAAGWVGVAAIAGAVLGAIARGWMRLISDDPEFSWSGTIFIVMAFTLHGLGVGLAFAVRRLARRRWVVTASRSTGGVLTLALFAGAGALMLPTVVTGSLARHRTDWRPAVRGALGVLACAVPVLLIAAEVDRLDEPRVVAGVVLFVGTYVAVVFALGPVVAPVGDGRRLRRGSRIVLIAAACLAAVGVALLTVGFVFS